MSIDYTIGDDIVAIKNHSQGIYKKGDVFTCKGLKESFCNCKNALVNIGLMACSVIDSCPKCDIYVNNTDNAWWCYADCFRKLDNLVQINEIHELLNQTIEG